MSVNGLEQQYIPPTLDGLNVIDADQIYIDGQLVDLDNLVPYTGAVKTVNLGSQNIQTSHTATTVNDLVNLKTLQDAIQYVEQGASLTFLNKTITSSQTVAGPVVFSGDTLTLNTNTTANGATTFNQLVQAKDLQMLTSDGIGSWEMTSSGTGSGGPYDLTLHSNQTSNNIIFRDTGKIEAKGFKDTDATANRVAIFDANKELTSNSVTTTELGYLTGATSNIQSQINAIVSGGTVSLSGNNSWTGNNNWLSNSLYASKQTIAQSFGSWTLVTGQSIVLGSGNTSITVTATAGAKITQIKSPVATIVPYQAYTFSLAYSTTANPFTASILDDLGNTLYTTSVSTGSGTLTGTFTCYNSSIIQLYANLATNGAQITWSAFSLTNNTVGGNVDYYLSGNNALLSKYLVNQTVIGAGASPYNNRAWGFSPSGVLYNNTDTTAGYGDALQLNMGQDTSRGSSNMLVLGKNAIKARLYQGTFGSTSAYSTYKDFYFQGDALTAGTTNITDTLTVSNNAQFGNYYLQRSVINYTRSTDSGKWFKIATILNSSTGVFRISWSAAGAHGFQEITAGIQYGSTPYIRIQNSSFYGGDPIPASFRLSVDTADITYGTHYIEMYLLSLSWYPTNVDIVVDWIDRSNQVSIALIQTKTTGTTTGYNYFQVSGYYPFVYNYNNMMMTFNNSGAFEIASGSGAKFTSSGCGYTTLLPGSSTRTGYINFYNANDSRMGYIGFGDGTDFLFNIEQSRTIRFYTGGTDRMKIRTDGTVAIGGSAAASPYSYCKLYVQDGATSGWAGMTYFGGASFGVVAGQYNTNNVYLGAHNAALTAWADITIAPGGNVKMPALPGSNNIPFSVTWDNNTGTLYRQELWMNQFINQVTSWNNVWYLNSGINRTTPSPFWIQGYVSFYSTQIMLHYVDLYVYCSSNGVQYGPYRSYHFFNQNYVHTQVNINVYLGIMPAGNYKVYLSTTGVTDGNDTIVLNYASFPLTN